MMSGNQCARRRFSSGDGEMVGVQPFLDHGRLLVKDHPRHDHGPDIGGDEIEIAVIAQRQTGQPRQHLLPVGMRLPRDPNESKFEKA